MSGGIASGVISVVQDGIASILLSGAFILVVSRLYDVDKNGVRVNDRYITKRVFLGLILATAVLSVAIIGLLRPIVAEQLGDVRILISSVGILILVFWVRTNEEVEAWNLIDENNSVIIFSASISLIILPWIGPIMFDYLARQIDTIVNWFTNFVVGGIVSFIEAIVSSSIEFLMSILLELAIIGILALIIIYYGN